MKKAKLAAAAKPTNKITKADFAAIKKQKADKLPKRGMRAGKGKK